MDWDKTEIRENLETLILATSNYFNQIKTKYTSEPFFEATCDECNAKLTLFQYLLEREPLWQRELFLVELEQLNDKPIFSSSAKIYDNSRYTIYWNAYLTLLKTYFDNLF